MKKTILITGAASGVGKEVALLFQDETIILLDKDEKKLSKVAKTLKAEYHPCDITHIEDLNTTIATISKSHKKIDILVHCAGVWTKGEMTKQEDGHFAQINTFERIKEVIDTNTYGTIAMIKSILPIMKKAGCGQIININSQGGIVTEEFCPIYNASKRGSRAFTQAILTDLAQHNIKVTDICPGLIKTDFYDNAGDPLPKEVMNNGLSPKDVANVVQYLINLPKNITIPSIEIKDIKNF